MLRVVIIVFSVMLWTCAALAETGDTPLRIGSKSFTESVILGEIAARLIEEKDSAMIHRRELGGTRILWGALQKGEIDIYPEYTGTLIQEILAKQNISGYEQLSDALDKLGVGITAPLGFNNTYALGMRTEQSESRGISRISDLKNQPDLKLGFSNEFMDRSDGWPGLRDAYGLPQKNVRGLDHDLAYRGLESHALDVIDLYSTDAEIEYYGLTVLGDDAGYFPEYRAVFLFRKDVLNNSPAVITQLQRLQGQISAADMSHMNARVKLDGVPESRVAADFLNQRFGVNSAVIDLGRFDQFVRFTLEHLVLVGISLSAAILVSIPLGILAARSRRTGHVILTVTGLIQTLPSLALFVFMIPLLGIGGAPAIVALFLYSLLPIVRNTCTGIREIPLHIRESAEALGLSSMARLRLVELPIALPTILTGIKTSAVINIGTATLGALIGAGGYGQPILTGIRLDDTGLILLGAVPAACLALLVQALFELLERFLVPRGLNL